MGRWGVGQSGEDGRSVERTSLWELESVWRGPVCGESQSVTACGDGQSVEMRSLGKMASLRAMSGPILVLTPALNCTIPKRLATDVHLGTSIEASLLRLDCTTGWPLNCLG